MEKRTAYNQIYYRAHREEEKKRSLDYYYQNKDQIDREKKKAYMRDYLKTYKRKPITPEKRAEINRLRRERYANDAEYREQIRLKSRSFNAKNPHIKKNGRLKAEFGITLEQYNQILEKQSGRCAICETKVTGVKERGKREHSLYVDHDHKTGKVRGILCNRCNFGIGQFKDDPQLLQKAAEYLVNGSSGVT
jgi:Recombination endonuclease VII.